MDKRYRVPKIAITERGLKKLLKKAMRDRSMTEWAVDNGITPQSISAFLRKVQGPGLKIPQVLGYKPQLVFIPLKADAISTANPPRRVTDRPTSKVDHSREPVEKKGLRRKSDRKETKKRLKKRHR